MNTTKISAALATYNEQSNIVDCILSLKKFSDEIVVADGESTDRTAQLARKLGAKVIVVPNNKMFHINKNIAIKNCSNEWVFVIDADERITQDLATEIKKVVSANPIENGYWINRKNWFLGGFLNKGGAYPDPVIRLFRKDKGIHPEVSVHEQILIDGKVGHLTNDIVHFADPSFERYLLRANRYTSLTSKDFSNNKLKKSTYNTIFYFIIKPLITFLNIYVRHKGYKDGFRGFIWALFSAGHYFYAYSKYLYDKN